MVKAFEASPLNTVDISKPQFKANPYPFYAQLRAEHPVFPVKLPDGQTAWLITRYDDALSALKDRRFSKDKLNAGQKQPWTPAFFKPLGRNMLDVDDPDHARLRGLVHKVFTPKMVENMRQARRSADREVARCRSASRSYGPGARVCLTITNFDHRANVGSTIG